MDESLQELEAELKALRPRVPSVRTCEQVELELAATGNSPARPRYAAATNFQSWKWSGWRVAGVAAALALLVAFGLGRFAPLSLQNPSAAPVAQDPAVQVAPVLPAKSFADDRYRPVAASNVLYDLKDEGPVNVGGDSTARRLRYRYLDTYTWKSTRGNGTLKWSVPRDEIRVIPVSLN